MKNQPLNRSLALAASSLGMALLFTPSARAAGGSWGTSTGNWTDSSKWQGSTIGGGTAGDVVNFTSDIAADTTVTVDGSNKIVGVLNIGDSNGSNIYTIAGSTSVFFNNGTNDAVLTQVATSKGDTFTAPVGIVGNGNLTISNASSATFKVNTPIQAGNAGLKTVTFDTSAGVIDLTGRVTNGNLGGTVAVVKNGSGTLKITNSIGSNTFTGGLTLNAGTLEIASAAALGNGTFTINGGTITNNNSARTLNTTNTHVWAGNFTFGSTSASGADLNIGTGAVSLAGNRTVTVNSNNTARTLTVGGAISGAGFSLTKAGNAVLALGGANTYDGGTIVSAGTLSTLSTGGTFGTGNVSVTGTTGKLVLGNADSIADTATLSFISTMGAGSINLNFTGTEFLAGISKTNGTPSSIVAGLFTAAELNSFFSTTIFTGTGSLQFGAIPEPSAYAALLGALCLAGSVWVRRRR